MSGMGIIDLGNDFSLVAVRTESDLARVQNLSHEIWPECFTGIISPAQIDYMLQEFYHPDILAEKARHKENFFLIRKDGEDCGYMSYLAGENDLRLCKLFLTRAQRGTGVAQTALDWLEGEARRHGALQMNLYVNVNNARAIRAYQKAGFGIVTTDNIDIGHGFFMNDHWMVKPL